MADPDENLLYIGIGIFAMFIFLLEPYAATRSALNFLILMGFVGIIGLAGVITLLYGIYHFFAKGEGIWFATGLVFIVFTMVVSSWPMEILLG